MPTADRKHPRITVDPIACHGKPTITGTRLLVSNILVDLAAGESVPQILASYPNLTEADIRAALAYASELAQF
jgi:uncharacterized protein (DUF433 family)